MARVTVDMIDEFLAERPIFDRLKPPLADDARLQAIEETGRWSGLIMSYAPSMSFGGELRIASTTARENGQIALRQLAPNERPEGLDAYAFQDYFLAAFRCEWLARSLRHCKSEIAMGERSQLGLLRERFNPRQKKIALGS